MGRRSQRKTNEKPCKEERALEKGKIIKKKSSVGEGLIIKRVRKKNSDVKSADRTKKNSAPEGLKSSSRRKKQLCNRRSEEISNCGQHLGTFCMIQEI